METAGTVDIFKRSVEKHNLRYNTFIALLEMATLLLIQPLLLKIPTLELQ